MSPWLFPLWARALFCTTIVQSNSGPGTNRCIMHSSTRFFYKNKIVYLLRCLFFFFFYFSMRKCIDLTLLDFYGRILGRERLVPVRGKRFITVVPVKVVRSVQIFCHWLIGLINWERFCGGKGVKRFKGKKKKKKVSSVIVLSLISGAMCMKWMKTFQVLIVWKFCKSSLRVNREKLFLFV